MMEYYLKNIFFKNQILESKKVLKQTARAITGQVRRTQIRTHGTSILVTAM